MFWVGLIIGLVIGFLIGGVASYKEQNNIVENRNLEIEELEKQLEELRADWEQDHSEKTKLIADLKGKIRKLNKRKG